MAGENKLSDKVLKALHGKPLPRQKMVADGRGLSVSVRWVALWALFISSDIPQGLDPRIENKLTKENLLTPVTVKNAIDSWFGNYAREKRKETVRL